MLTEDKVTELFFMADEFCKFFDWMMTRYTLKNTGKRPYHRESTLSKAEIMLIIILFHDSGYRCFKHFYLDNVCKHLRHLFQKVVSYNRFVELEKSELLNFMITPGDIDDREPLKYNAFVEFLYGKLVGDKGYIGKELFQRLFVNGIQLITKLKSNMKGALMSVSDKLLLRKRTIIETVNDELKNIAQIEHSRHRCFDNFIVNILGAIAAYCMFPKKPCINVQRTLDTQLTLF
ncbi:MAG: transposase [Bacteroidaceae bacterium]|nr:transposase [Bacteroidaceae bacterium]